MMLHYSCAMKHHHFFWMNFEKKKKKKNSAMQHHSLEGEGKRGWEEEEKLVIDR
jgi:hypothetical protein